MKYGMKPMGTHPHEWFMFHGAQFGYKHANYMALENWVNVYDGDLGIALSDTHTSGIFYNLEPQAGQTIRRCTLRLRR